MSTHAYTQIPGHGLQAEGKPFIPGKSQDVYNLPGWTRAEGKLGHGVCSCGASSDELGTDAGRKRWFDVHKNEVILAWTGIRDALRAER